MQVQYTVEFQYFEPWFLEYNGCVEMICMSRFKVFYPQYLKYLDISKFLNSPI